MKSNHNSQISDLQNEYNQNLTLCNITWSNKIDEYM